MHSKLGTFISNNTLYSLAVISGSIAQIKFFNSIVSFL